MEGFVYYMYCLVDTHSRIPVWTHGDLTCCELSTVRKWNLAISINSTIRRRCRECRPPSPAPSFGLWLRLLWSTLGPTTPGKSTAGPCTAFCQCVSRVRLYSKLLQQSGVSLGKGSIKLAYCPTKPVNVRRMYSEYPIFAHSADRY